MTESVRAEPGRMRTKAESEQVFVRKDDAGKPLRDARKPFKKALGASRISGFAFLDLRPAAASYMVMRGLDLRTVRDILGHEDLRMTMRCSHLSPRHRRNAVQVLDSIGHPLDTGRGSAYGAGEVVELKWGH